MTQSDNQLRLNPDQIQIFSFTCPVTREQPK
jgi:hypothetical protein